MISMIVAHGKNRCIGSNGDMPWGKSIKSDLAWFKENTLGKTIIMGRKTYNSIGMPLPNRRNIVITSNLEAVSSLVVEYVRNIPDALDKIENEEECFVIGGSTLYNQFLPYVDRLYITHIDSEFEGDTYFPKVDFSRYEKLFSHRTYDIYNLEFSIYQKK